MSIDGSITASKPAEHGAFMLGPEPARIGPNAILQSVEVMREALGERRTQAILDDAQIDVMPTGDGMIPEIEAIRLHRWLTLHEPSGGFTIAHESGLRTADYIIAHRIPKSASKLLQHLPAHVAAPILMAAIRRHAWTFVGAGRFETQGGWKFSIDRKFADDPVLPSDTLYHWYAAVFTRLYERLVSPRSRCRDMGAPDDAPLRHNYTIELTPH